MNEFHLISSNAHGANYSKQEKIKLKNLISYKLNEGEKVFCSNFSLDLSQTGTSYRIEPRAYSYLEVENKNAKITTTLLCTSNTYSAIIENNYEKNQNLYIKPESIKDLDALCKYFANKNFYLSKHQVAFDYKGEVKVNFSHFNGGEKHVNNLGNTQDCIPSFFTDLSFQTMEESETIVTVSPKNNIIDKGTNFTANYHIADCFTNESSNVYYQRIEWSARHINEVFLSKIKDNEMPEKIFINKNVYVEKTNSFISVQDHIGHENKTFSINFKISSNKKMTNFLSLDILSQNSNHPDNIGQVTLEKHILEIKGGCKINLKKLSPEKTISTIVESIRPKDVFVSFSIKTISKECISFKETKEFIPFKEGRSSELFSSKIVIYNYISIKDMVNKLFPSIDYAPNFKNKSNDNYDENINNDNSDMRTIISDDNSDTSYENFGQSLCGENLSLSNI